MNVQLFVKHPECINNLKSINNNNKTEEGIEKTRGSNSLGAGCNVTKEFLG